MKVLFVDGNFSGKEYVEPLGISYLAAVTKPIASCKVYEPAVYGDSIKTAVTKVIDGNPDVIGLSFLTPNTDNCKAFIEEYHKAGKQCLFLVGGHGPSLMPQDFLDVGADYVFIGEGEISVPEFIHTLIHGGDLHDVRGIAYLDNGKLIQSTPPDRIDNLDLLPFMERDVLKELMTLYPGVVSARMLSSRGCYMNCEYCSIQTYTDLQGGKRYRERSVESLLEEMNYLYKSLGVTQFLFEDDNFIPLNKEKAKKKIDCFCEGVKKLGIPNIKLHLQCRPDNFNENFIIMLKECGLVDLFMGVESINQSDITFYGRKSDTKQSIHVMEELEKIGFSCDVNAEYRLRIGYIIFQPESTRESLRASGEFLKKFHVTPKKLVNVLRPYPHTKVRDKMISKGYLDDNREVVFQDQEIEKIFKATTHIVRKILSLREQLRLPAKLNSDLILEFAPNVQYTRIDQLRAYCDNLCFEAFFELLDAVDVQTVIKKYDSVIEEMKSSEEIKETLVHLKKEMNISMVEKGIYR